MFRGTLFQNSLRSWIVYCQITGLFPYYISEQRIVKRKYYLLIYFNSFLFYCICESSFMITFKNRFPNFGLFIMASEFFIILLWIIFGISTNDILISTFSLFDKFDRSFRMHTGKDIQQEKIYQVLTVKMVMVIFTGDYCIMVLLAYRSQPLVESIFISLFRTIQRTIVLSFISMYFHFIHSLNVRFKRLKQIWEEQIEVRVHNTLVHSTMIVKIGAIRLMYNQLLNIVKSINDCFGPRFVILFIQLFYRVLKYFYITCTGLHHVAWLEIYPLCLIFMITLTTQNLSTSADFTPQLLKLPTSKTPDRLLLQIYGFLQQLRTCPLQINAAGFFTINKKLLNTLAMALASYLVAIFQLAPLMERIGKRTSYGIL